MPPQLDRCPLHRAVFKHSLRPEDRDDYNTRHGLAAGRHGCHNWVAMNTADPSEILSRCPKDVAAQAVEVFESQKAAAEWLTTPAFGLRGRVPLDLLGTAKGRADVKTLLQRIDYGIPP